MENISVKCKSCGAEFMVPSSLAGQRARCSCGQPLNIPAPGGEVSGAAPGAGAPSPQKLRAAKWYVNEGGEAQGPFSWQDLRNRVLRGTLQPHHKVYANPLGGWRTVAQVEVLQPGYGADQKDQWYVAVGGRRYGPYSTERMNQMLKEGRVTGKSQVWSQSLGEWRPLRRVGRFAAGIQQSQAGQAVEEMWFYMRNGERVGPLSLEQMVNAIRDGRVKATDRVWSNRLEGWVDASSVPELADALKAGASRGAAATGELWYFRHAGKVGGPVSFQELCARVERKELVAGDTVFNKGLQSWKDIRDVPELEGAIAAAETGLGKADREQEEWYYRVGGKERGPVTERFLAELLAKDQLQPDDRVFGPGSEKWRRVHEVPELARYVDFSKVGAAPKPTRDREATSMVTGITDGRPASSKLWKKVGLAAVAVLVVGLAAVLFIEMTGGDGNGEENGPRQFRVPEEPVPLVHAWLELFLKDAGRLPPVEADVLRERLKLFYPDGYMDVYAADVRARLRKKWSAAGNGAGIRIEEQECDLLRADDEENFVYYRSSGETELTVRAAVPPDKAGPEGTTREKTFASKDFRVLRCFRIETAAGARREEIHDSALVMVIEQDGKPRIIAMGRLAHVGARAGEMEVRYATGYKAPEMTEAACLLHLGIERHPGAEGQQWDAYGELMSVDSNLVSASVLQCRTEAEKERMTVDSLLVRAQTGKMLADVTGTYGQAQTTRELSFESVLYKVKHAEDSASERLLSTVEAKQYGNFGVVVDPVSNEVVGFLFMGFEVRL